MAQANSGRQLPEYNMTLLGDFLKLPAKDPQEYTNVLTQVYPLPADIDALTSFCDKFFNYGSPDPWTFEPAVPWVVLQVCNYGKMAMRSQNVGWVSQHELAFGFPVAWYETENGQRKFKDWAMVYPYIYVDDPLSMSLGRQVYGWAKAGIQLMLPRPSLQPSMRCLVSIDLKGGPGGPGVDDQTRPRFLEILQHQPLLSGRSGFATLYSLPARAMGLYLSAASGMLGTFDSMVKGFQERLSDYADSGHSDRAIQGLIRESVNLTRQTRLWNDYLDVFLKNARGLTLAQEGLLGGPAGSRSIEQILGSTEGKVRIITRKQFRDAADPTQACFSAIVGSTMEYGQPIDGAPFLSDPLSPDPSGGIQIHLRDDGIVKDLGLETYGKLDDGVSVLRPVMPFWVKLNAKYSTADCQEWRTKNWDWAVDSTDTRSAIDDAATTELAAPKYNPGGSDAFQEVPGPMKAANFGLWIYGLKAEKKTLTALCANYLNHQDENGQPIYRFNAEKPPEEMLPGQDEKSLYVLMMVSSFDDLCGTGKEPEFKVLSDRVLTFAIPAKCERIDGKIQETPVLIPLYTFVEQDWDFLTEYEVYGRLAFKSLLESPPERWIDKSKGKHLLLTVQTQVFPVEKKEAQGNPEAQRAEGAAQGKSEPQRARFKPLIQIWEPQRPKPEETRELSTGSGAEFTGPFMNTYLNWLGIQEASTKSAGAKSDPAAIRSLALKQVRDAIDADRACYQAIVGVNRKIGGGWSMASDPRNLEVRFFENTGMTIRETMGITGGELVDRDQFYKYYGVDTVPGGRIYGKMADEKAQNLCWTIEKGKWRDDLAAAEQLFPAPKPQR